MVSHVIEHGHGSTRPPESAGTSALRNYYFMRAGVAAVWVAAAVSIGATMPVAAIILLVGYPAWDAIANWIDAESNGGLKRNRTQALNLVVSAATAAGVAAALPDMHAVLAVFGAWAIFAGLLQLATAVRRWTSFGAQWAMILSGAQSALAGGFFIARSRGSDVPGIADVAPYAAFGAFYFLVSALWLTFRPGASNRVSD